MDEKFWRNAPKTYIDDSNIAVVQGLGNLFLLALASGGNAQVFAFTPEHMKRFSQLIEYKIKEFEKTNGEIQVEPWDPGMKSPLSVADIKSGGK